MMNKVWLAFSTRRGHRRCIKWAPKDKRCGINWENIRVFLGIAAISTDSVNRSRTSL